MTKFEHRPLMLTTSDIDRMLRHAPSPQLRDLLLDLRNGERITDGPEGSRADA